MSTVAQPLRPADPRRDVSLIVSADRMFAQERYQFRAFSVYNPSEGSSFVRGIFTAKLRDDVAVETSGGWFAGDGRDRSAASPTATSFTRGSSITGSFRLSALSSSFQQNAARGSSASELEAGKLIADSFPPCSSLLTRL